MNCGFSNSQPDVFVSADSFWGVVVVFCWANQNERCIRADSLWLFTCPLPPRSVVLSVDPHIDEWIKVLLYFYYFTWGVSCHIDQNSFHSDSCSFRLSEDQCSWVVMFYNQCADVMKDSLQPWGTIAEHQSLSVKTKLKDNCFANSLSLVLSYISVSYPAHLPLLVNYCSLTRLWTQQQSVFKRLMAQHFTSIHTCSHSCLQPRGGRPIRTCGEQTTWPAASENIYIPNIVSSVQNLIWRFYNDEENILTDISTDGFLAMTAALLCGCQCVFRRKTLVWLENDKFLSAFLLMIKSHEHVHTLEQDALITMKQAVYAIFVQLGNKAKCFTSSIKETLNKILHINIHTPLYMYNIYTHNTKTSH